MNVLPAEAEDLLDLLIDRNTKETIHAHRQIMRIGAQPAAVVSVPMVKPSAKLRSATTS